MGCSSSSKASLVEELQNELRKAEHKKQETIEQLAEAKQLIQSLSFNYRKTLKKLQALEEQVWLAQLIADKDTQLKSLSACNTGESLKNRTSL